MLVRWCSVLSDSFKMHNGTRQGSLLSPYFFARYVRSILRTVHDTRIGCNIGGIMYNILAYADDMVLVAPSWAALQFLIDTLCRAATIINMICNCLKTCCMIFNPCV